MLACTAPLAQHNAEQQPRLPRAAFHWQSCPANQLRQKVEKAPPPDTHTHTRCSPARPPALRPHPSPHPTPPCLQKVVAVALQRERAASLCKPWGPAVAELPALRLPHAIAACAGGRGQARQVRRQAQPQPEFWKSCPASLHHSGQSHPRAACMPGRKPVACAD